MAEVEVELKNRAAVLTINRPESRNAIGLETIGELERALDQVFASDAEVLAILGSGERVFVSGGDLKQLAKIRDDQGARQMALRMRRVLDRLANSDIPVIAVLNGHALGGGAEVALAADIRIAASDIKIGFNQTNLSIIPAWGGIERLTQAVGRSKAMLLVATGLVISANDAHRLGLVDLVVERIDFNDAWRDLVRTFANLTPGTGASIKRSVSSSWKNIFPESEGTATADFARLWVGDAHWESVEDIKSRAVDGEKPLWSNSITS